MMYTICFVLFCFVPNDSCNLVATRKFSILFIGFCCCGHGRIVSSQTLLFCCSPTSSSARIVFATQRNIFCVFFSPKNYKLKFTKKHFQAMANAQSQLQYINKTLCEHTERNGNKTRRRNEYKHFAN